MRNYMLFALSLLLLLVGQARAQTRTVTGKVTEETSGQPLPGVTVLVKGSQVGTTTNVHGDYSLALPATGATLTFSFIGYASTNRVIGSATVLDVALRANAKNLNEVIVIGYGTQEKREISGAIASVKGEEIRNLPVASVDRVLQGRAAGVQVNSNNGLPGGSSQVRIRGLGSVNAGNEPLYIIDGVQVTGTDRSRGITSSNPLNAINVNDIASVEVLKDAAAASIYGAQAGNGVVLITTRAGKSGKPRYHFNTYQGFTEILNKPRLLNSTDWITLRREAATNMGAFSTGTVNAPGAVDATYGLAADAKTYDWIDAVTRRGGVQHYELGVNGGNEMTRYYISGAFDDQKYQFIGSDFKRGTFRINLDNKLHDKLAIETRINLSTVTQHSSFGPVFNVNNIYVGALGALPMNPVYNEDGSYNLAMRGVISGNANPVSVTDKNKNLGVTNQAIANFAVNYDLLKGLRFRSSYSLEFTDLNEEEFLHPATPGGSPNNGVVNFRTTRVVNWQTDQTLNYNQTFKEHHALTGLLGFNYRNEVYTSLSVSGNQVATPDYGQTLAGTTVTAGLSGYSNYKLAGVFSRIGYTFKDRYIAQFTLRRDGSSRFGADTKFGYFPAGAVAWRLSDEAFMAAIPLVSDLKVRVSYGVTGNSQFLAAGLEANFPALSLFSTNTASSYNGRAGTQFSQLGNARLGWEKNHTRNIGLDYGILENRISGSLDAYVRTTKDLLLSRPLPQTTGFANIAQNVGELENRGLEIALFTQNLVGAFQWTTEFNIAFNKNKVLALLPSGGDLPANNLWIGKPLGQQYVAKWAGVNPADGRAMWYDSLNNITYNPLTRDRQFIDGSTLVPKYVGGLTNTFTYKGLELLAFFQYQVGNIAVDNIATNLTSDFRYEGNAYASMLDRWTTPGQLTAVPALYAGAQRPGMASSLFGGAVAGSDRFHEDGSYMRLKQVLLAYSLPAELAKKIRTHSVRVYVQGTNLLTWTNFKGLDPEFTANAVNVGIAPQGKTFTAGIQIGL